MFTAEERTEERASAYVEALRHEIDGYKVKVEQALAVNDGDKADLYKGRIQQVEAEIKNASPKKSEPKSKAPAKGESDQQ